MPSRATASTTTAPSVPTVTNSSCSARWIASIGWKATMKAFCARSTSDESARTDRQGPEPGQVHRLSYLLGDLQERVDLARGHGVRVVQQRGDQARDRLPQGLGE